MNSSWDSKTIVLRSSGGDHERGVSSFEVRGEMLPRRARQNRNAAIQGGVHRQLGRTKDPGRRKEGNRVGLLLRHQAGDKKKWGKRFWKNECGGGLPKGKKGHVLPLKRPKSRNQRH